MYVGRKSLQCIEAKQLKSAVLKRLANINPSHLVDKNGWHIRIWQKVCDSDQKYVFYRKKMITGQKNLFYRWRFVKYLNSSRTL